MDLLLSIFSLRYGTKGRLPCANCLLLYSVIFDNVLDRSRREGSASRPYSESDIFRFVNILPDTLFAALAHKTRLRCLLLLLSHDELCVCELTHAIDVAQPSISRHLGQLREAGLVSDRREGLWIHYRLHPDLPEWARRILHETALGVTGQQPYANDMARIAAMPGRPARASCG